MYLNKKHATRRQELGKSAVVVDRSIMNARELEISNEVEGSDSTGDRAFDNETDLKNEDFIFVY
jgi:hypothetical protein